MPKRRKRRRNPVGQEHKIEREKVKRSHVSRVNTIYGIVFLSFTALIFRMSYLQIAHGVQFRKNETPTILNTIPVLPARGRIYDSSGTLIAYDQPIYNVVLTQAAANSGHFQVIADKLAPVFQTTPASILSQIKSQQQNATINVFKDITPKQLAYVMENKNQLPGVTVELASERRYPFGALAGHVLGYVGPITSQTENYYVNQLHYLRNEQVGESGIESQYNKLLEGTAGKQVVQISGSSTHPAGMNPAPVSGQSLQLTLDGHLQAETQKEITTFISHSKNKNTINDAAAVMLDVKTGGVLSLVSYPYYNPNWYTVSGQLGAHLNYLSTSGAQQNNAIQNPNYPGSTVKPANLITGLEQKVITPSTAYTVPYNIQIASSPKHDDAPHGYVNDAMAVTVSSDVFFYNIGLWLSKWMGSSPTNGGAPAGGVSLQTWRDTDFAKGMTDLFNGEWRLGLGQITGIDLPGEQAGRFYVMDANKSYAAVPFPLQKATQSVRKTGSYKNYSTPVSIALAAIGQEQQFTPIELAQYVATIADGGKRIQPHLLQAVYPPSLTNQLSAKQKPLQTVQPKVQNQVKLNPTYLGLAQQGMYGVCNNPLGTAYVDFLGAPYKAAGKTGTADIYLNGVHMTNSVFIAYAPYKNPQIAVAVMIPGGGYGADSAAAVARKMMDTYFKEHHEFFPKSQWGSATIPANWMTSAANTSFTAK